MQKKNVQITILGIFLNFFLFLIKIAAGLMSGSLALITDAINSFTDCLSSTMIFWAVRISNKSADKGHPFGHHRVQPLAAFMVAIFTAIFGFEIIKSAVGNLTNPQVPVVTFFAISVPIITIIIKGYMAAYFTRVGKKLNSPAIVASGVDSRNDIIASSVVLLALVGIKFNLVYLDSAVALILALFIFYSGYKLAQENINYLVGRAAPKDEIKQMKNIARGIKGVKGLNDVRAHFVGNFVHIEIHIEVNKKLSTLKSHDIGKQVQKAIESLDYVDKCFVHIDPV